MAFYHKGLLYPCPMWADVIRSMEFGFNNSPPNRIAAIRQTMEYSPWRFRFNYTYLWDREDNSIIVSSFLD